jgi:hypothetical protein
MTVLFCIGYGKKYDSQVTWVMDKTLSFPATYDRRRYAKQVTRYVVCSVIYLIWIIIDDVLLTFHEHKHMNTIYWTNK